MGRPLNKKYFGDPALPGKQVKMTDAWIPGESAPSSHVCYIVKQVGTGRYKIAEKAPGTASGVVRLVEKNKVLEPGEAKLKVQPKGQPASAAEYAYKIFNRSVSTWEGSRYYWSIDVNAPNANADLEMD